MSGRAPVSLRGLRGSVVKGCGGWGDRNAALVLAPSLLYLFRVFKSSPDAPEPTPR